MELKVRVEAIVREAGLLPATGDDPPISIEASMGGTVVIRRHPGGTANVDILVGDILRRVAQVLSDQGLHVTEEGGAWSRAALPQGLAGAVMAPWQPISRAVSFCHCYERGCGRQTLSTQ